MGVQENSQQTNPKLAPNQTLMLFTKAKPSTSFVTQILRTFTPTRIPYERNIYNSAWIESDDLPEKSDTLLESLNETLTHFQTKQIKGVWVQIKADKAHLIPHFLKNNFVYHHTEGDDLTMTKWLSNETQNSLPSFCTHYCGVGGLVVDTDTQEVLLIKEKAGHWTNRWKIPGGHVNRGETLNDAMVREVWEETGVNAEFVGLIGIKENTNYKFDSSDLYLVGLMKNLDREIKMCPTEVSECEWRSIDSCIEEFQQNSLMYQMIRNSLNFIKGGLNGNEPLDLVVDGKNTVSLSTNDLLLMDMQEGFVKIHDKKVPQNYYVPQLFDKLYGKKK